MKVGSIILHGRDGKIYHGKEIKLHDKYNSQTKENDIALLRLRENIESNDKISSVQITTHDVVKKGDVAIFAGWGRLEVSY